MPDDLKKELESAGVNTSDAPDDDDIVDIDDLDDDDEDQPSGAGTSKNTGEVDDDDDRPAVNRQREFERKLNKATQALQQQIADLRAQLVNQPQPQPQPQPVAQPRVSSSGGFLDSYSDDQLQAGINNPQATPDQVRMLQTELTRRREAVLAQTLDQKLDERLSAVERDRQVRDREAKAAQTAAQRYPQMTNINSKFYRMVQSELSSRRALSGRQPGDTLDAANAIALQLGVAPRTLGNPGYAAPGGSGMPAREGKPERIKYELADEQVDSLAERFEKLGVLPAGKKFNKARIKKNNRRYAENAHLYGL